MTVSRRPRIQHFRSAELIQVIKVECGEGLGTTGSVYRIVTRYIDPVSGELLAFNDPDGGHDFGVVDDLRSIHTWARRRRRPHRPWIRLASR